MKICLKNVQRQNGFRWDIQDREVKHEPKLNSKIIIMFSYNEKKHCHFVVCNSV